MDGLRVNPVHSMQNLFNNPPAFHHAFKAAPLEALKTMLANAVSNAAQIGDLNKRMDIIVNFPERADAAVCQRFQGCYSLVSVCVGSRSRTAVFNNAWSCSRTSFKAAQICYLNKRMDIIVNFSESADAAVCQRFQGCYSLGLTCAGKRSRTSVFNWAWSCSSASRRATSVCI